MLLINGFLNRIKYNILVRILSMNELAILERRNSEFKRMDNGY